MKINIVNYFNELDYSKTIELVLKKASEVLHLEQQEITIILVDNKYIQELNKQYRNKDYPTDVLTFETDQNHYLGDIFISIEKAHEQAKEYNHTFERELGFLTVHGVLHTLGYDHQTNEQEAEMTALQEEILQKVSLSR